ncbi:PREDICTED: coiled-coil and C2 domain-containing protein 1A-like, partial [Dipodomys ordii]|uniref:Coiled-coil and C2 domain-containing protein 1A-like n=1 Tax=Dipodomys ordii TaxID=10020 RepID=A0A1S3GUP1_DIPOR
VGSWRLSVEAATARPLPALPGPLPMEAIERMARLCMRDPDEEEEETDDDVEADDDLLAELNEVLGEEQKAVEPPPAVAQPKPSAPHPGVEATLQERLALYQCAIEGARQAGDSAKVRRYDRGLKTLEDLLAAVRKGSAIDEGDIPPPVAVGKGPGSTPSHTPAPPQPAPEPQPPLPGPPVMAPVLASCSSTPQLPSGRQGTRPGDTSRAQTEEPYSGRTR